LKKKNTVIENKRIIEKGSHQEKRIKTSDHYYGGRGFAQQKNAVSSWTGEEQ